MCSQSVSLIHHPPFQPSVRHPLLRAAQKKDKNIVTRILHQRTVTNKRCTRPAGLLPFGLGASSMASWYMLLVHGQPTTILSTCRVGTLLGGAQKQLFSSVGVKRAFSCRGYACYVFRSLALNCSCKGSRSLHQSECFAHKMAPRIEPRAKRE